MKTFKLSKNNKETALVIDDSMTNLFLLEAVLKQRGMTVHKEQFPLDVVALVEQWMPDIIFLDYMMPVKTGLEILPEIRLQFDTPVVIVSVYDDPVIMQGARALGADCYIQKPFKVKTIFDCCDHLLV